MSVVKQLPNKDNRKWSRNIVDWSELDINTDRRQLSGVDVKRSHARPKVLSSTPAWFSWMCTIKKSCSRTKRLSCVSSDGLTFIG